MVNLYRNLYVGRSITISAIKITTLISSCNYMPIPIPRNVHFFCYLDINIGLMLNFPKIKKFLRDEDKLIQYLREDEKYETRNYVVEF